MTGKNLFALSFVAALTALAPAARAVTLAPGDSVFVPGTTLAASPELAGTVLTDEDLGYYDFDPAPPTAVGHHYEGTVILSDATGTLIFAPQLVDPLNITFGDVVLDQMVLTGFGGFETDVTYLTDGDGDRGPTFAERSGDGDALTFTFGFPLTIGNLVQEVQEESYPIVIVTDATAYESTGVATFYGRSELFPGEVLVARIDGIPVPVLAPVPLPAGALLLLSGLALLVRRAHRTD